MTSESNTLTASHIERQNVLNNPFAVQKLQEHLGLQGITWQGEPVFLKQQVAALLDVDARTINRYLASHEDELTRNGYLVLRGKNLRDFKLLTELNDMNVPQKTQAVGIFRFRTVLNLAMLLTDSERARAIRSKILDIVIETIAAKAGGATKYINQRDADYLPAAFQEENYRKQFTDAVGKHIAAPNWKYGKYTNLVYEGIFRENAQEYRNILKLAANDKVRDTLYAEVLDLVASFEAGLAYELEQRAKELGRPLSIGEADRLFQTYTEHPQYAPLINQARTKMASRDLCFRDALHHKLEAYIQSVPEADFERFLGEKSKDLQERIAENLDVFKRLKDR
ncbi:hypothetical protein [Megalodesulfovibrio gigas]|uniref:Putative CiaB protein n=1 Tax=Megalodesulfovibrio gigas (strain ATCC 19364 / DSM 1382 / NCIMB 9332 / VKM B-1759) TaxID=1121448 RepID=T2GAE9_MEGG1|nr:hypothetical protein [Megalodesulfovibrio gigas]AGW13149.1 putative CiaB protein [Megalodesulfovibrio gigas DSM 1382 = ATCC 19364]